MRRLVPAGDPVVLAAQHAIERPANVIKTLTVIGRDRLVDQRIDNRIGDPEKLGEPLPVADLLEK